MLLPIALALSPFAAPPRAGAGGGSSLLDGLLAYYRLEETSGARVDLISARNLSDINSVGAAAGKIGNAAQFVTAGSKELNLVDAAGTFFLTGDRTFSFWLWLDRNSGQQVPLAWIGGRFAVHMFGPNPSWYFIDQFGAFGSVDSPFSMSISTWYHVVATYRAADNQMAIRVNNGTPTAATFGITPFRSGGQTTFAVGSRGGELWLDGRVDELGIWSRVLTGPEITSLFGAGAGLAYPFS